MHDLEALAQLLREMNGVTNQIAALIQRPALTGHIGEFIGSRVFDIGLEASATARAIDGRFRSGPLTGRSVNIKYYPKRETLDMDKSSHPDFYLALTGPRNTAATSKGAARPYVITNAYLFESTTLCAGLVARGVKIQTGTSLLLAQWDAAEIHPGNACRSYEITAAQHALLNLFAPSDA